MHLPAALELLQESLRAWARSGGEYIDELVSVPLALCMELSELFRIHWDSKCDPLTSSIMVSPGSLLKM